MELQEVMRQEEKRWKNLMELIEKNWKFDIVNYPNFPWSKAGDGRSIKIATIRHIQEHQLKALKKIVEARTYFNHGTEIDHKKCRLAVRNFFINTSRLAVVMNISPSTLAKVAYGIEIEATMLSSLNELENNQIVLLGKLAEECEPTDHGAVFNMLKVSRVIVELFVNTLRIARVIGMKREELEQLVRDWAEEKHTV